MTSETVALQTQQSGDAIIIKRNINGRSDKSNPRRASLDNSALLTKAIIHKMQRKKKKINVNFDELEDLKMNTFCEPISNTALQKTTSMSSISFVSNLRPSIKKKRKLKRSFTLGTISAKKKPINKQIANMSMTPTRHMHSKRVRQTSSKLSNVYSTIKLSKTKRTDEPYDIINAKIRLKGVKKFTTQIEQMATNLHVAQNETIKLSTIFHDKLNNITVAHSEDKFAIFVNNIGKCLQNTEALDQMHIISMEDQLINPVKKFNHGEIDKCKQLKTKLKSKKHEYDTSKKKENKLAKTHQKKDINLQKMYTVKRKSKLKLNELQSIRNEFVSAVELMEKEKLILLSSMQEYMNSYGAYSQICDQTIKMQKKMMHDVPANIYKRYKFDLDSDTEDVNDDDEMTVILKRNVILREGWIKKRGKVNKQFKKRWFKLFANKKLIYFSDYGPNGVIKGHIDLTKAVNIIRYDADNIIEMETQCRVWNLQFISMEERDCWYDMMTETKGVTITETANEFITDIDDIKQIEGNMCNARPIMNVESPQSEKTH